MCQACGCRQITVIDQLSREHEYLLALIDQVRNAAEDGGQARIRDLVGEIRRVLRPHNRVEEDGLFPALIPYVPDRIAALVADHRSLDKQLAELSDDSTIDSSGLNKLLTAIRTLCEHIAAEKDALFPVAMACLGPIQTSAIEHVRKLAGDPLARHESGRTEP